MKYQTELKTAQEAVRRAGEIIRKSYAALRSDDVSEKRANDMVTVVDIESQRSTVTLLRERFRTDFIVAEESFEASVNQGIASDAPRRWYIDPLDGTTNYIHAYPMFAASIALQEDGEMVMGVTYDPMRDELFHAVRGEGAYMNDARIRVSTISSKVRTLLATGFPFRAREYLDEYLKTFRFFFNNSRGIRRGGSATLDLAYVAIGRVDAFWEMTLSPWDMAAGVILIEEAGGTVTDFFGEKNSLANGHIVATNGAFHDWMCEHIQSVFPKGTDLSL
ncbi:MAG: inositol monophosphatase family protein [Candidatus Krumholzibacteria bacterium]